MDCCSFSSLPTGASPFSPPLRNVVLTLLRLCSCFVNLFHLNAASGLSQYPWDPTAPIYIGSAEYSMRRCWEAVHSLKEVRLFLFFSFLVFSSRDGC